MLDEPAEYGADAHDYDPIDPSLGRYYLYDELRKRTHVSVFGSKMRPAARTAEMVASERKKEYNRKRQATPERKAAHRQHKPRLTYSRRN